jgi:hypothetical protein
LRKPDPIEVNADGTTVYVRPLNAGQYRRLVAYMRSKDADPVYGDFLLIYYSCHDKDGNPLFKSVEEAETMTNEACNALLPVCVKAKGFGTEEQKKSPSEATPSN